MASRILSFLRATGFGYQLLRAWERSLSWTPVRQMPLASSPRNTGAAKQNRNDNHLAYPSGFT